MINYKFEYEYTNHFEKMTKLKLVEKIQESGIKYKCMDRWIENLSYDDEICIQTLDLLCKVFSRNVMIIDGYLYHQSIYDESSNIIFVFNGTTCFQKDIDQLDITIQQKYKIDNIHRPYCSMSYYKLDDLVNISLILPFLSVVNENGKTPKKKDYYDAFTSFIDNTVFTKTL